MTRWLISFVVAVTLLSAACKRASNITKEVAYVNAPQVILRDRLSTIYEKKGTVKLGEKVYVINHERRFTLVRNDRGEEGWIADRYLITAKEFEQFQKLSSDNTKTPSQTRGTTRTPVNLHLTPGRDTEHLFQLKEGEKVDVLKRGTAEKPNAFQPSPAGNKKPGEKETGTALVPVLDDWVLVRNGEGQAGWVLSRLVDVDIPLEIAQYAEGQRIVSAMVINEVQDEDKKVPQYLVMLSENKDGLPWDYNQIRVFTWNPKKHRYETAYRERDLVGVFPVKIGTEDFGKEGVLPVFSLTVKTQDGKESERKYRMIGPIVRRVASPEELKQESTERAARRQENKQTRGKKRR